jgi:NAD(P)-dependent dehydrogenase (short-subunit alcohol dehydrogenase family)
VSETIMDFTNKTVVITGAGAGVGKGLAAGFCRDGANVVGFGRTRGTLEETAAQFGQGRMHVVTGDVANSADVDRLFAEALSRFGKVDILINNAAIYPRELFLEAPIERLSEVLEVNVVGMARCCRAALPGMLQNGHGRILNVGSFAWKGPIPTALAYSVSKAAVHALTKAIAAEVDRGRFPDVLVNEFLPGVVKTSMSPEGIDPADVYPHARTVASLPKGGPHGEVFLQSELYVEYPSFGTRLKRKLGLG